jgi:hypothetical protein
LVGDSLLLRAGETEGREAWFAVPDLMTVEAHRLVERGYLERAVVHIGDYVDLLYRATDRAVQAQEIFVGAVMTITSN